MKMSGALTNRYHGGNFAVGCDAVPSYHTPGTGETIPDSIEGKRFFDRDR